MFRLKALAVLFVCTGFTVTTRPAAAQVQLTINSGRVSVSAKNATAAQILAEWARVGQTRIVNAERIGGTPLTLELANVPEVEAIEVILRSASGYVLAPRRTEAANVSRYDRILILPPSSAVAAPPRVAAAPTQGPTPRPFAVPQPGQFTAQQPGQAPATDDNDDPADRPVPVNPGVQPPRAPVFNTFPQVPQQRTEPPPPAPPASTVTAPPGVAVPGMVVPTPPPPGQPGVIQTQQPPQR